MTTASRQQAAPGEHAPVPQVVASYAAYLQTRTGLTPDVTVTGDDVSVSVSTEDKELVLTFQFGRGGWALHGAEVREVRDGGQSRIFARGELAAAVGVLIGGEGSREACSRSPEQYPGIPHYHGRLSQT